MPEGPEIWRAASRIEKALGHGPLVDVYFGFERLQAAETALHGAQVLSVRPRGKALLTSFSTGDTLYSHNQLYGVWRVARAATPLRPTTRALRVRLSTEQGTAALYSATDVELWRSEDVHEHPFLQRLGPDVLDPLVDGAVVAERLRSFPERRRRLGTLLLDQGFLCGIGNYLRAEILWLAGLHPRRTLASLDDDEAVALAQALLDVPRASFRFRHARGEQRFTFAVFQQEGRACRRCGESIVRVDDGGRRLYLCTTCQPAATKRRASK